MTLSALGVVAVYAGSGSPGPFSLTDAGANPILFATNSEIVVSKYINPDDTNPVLQVITTNYTLTGAGLGTPGAVTLTAPLAVGETLLIQRVTASTQALDLAFGGDLSLENLEAELDKQIRLIQELREIANRSLQFPAIRETLANVQTRMVPVPVAGQLLAWNATADRLVNASGHLFYSGSGAPSAALGGDGDFYIDYTNNLLYGPKVGASWGSGISIVGPQGEQGEQGIQGIPGPLGSGNGDVTGAASSTDNAVVRFDLTTGKLLQNSVVLIGDTGAITGALSLDLPNAGLLLRDTNASHTLQISPGTNLTANRIFTLTTGDAARSLDISANDVVISAFAASYLDDGTASAMRTTIGAGDVVGPASSVASRLAIFSGTSGKLLADGGVTAATVATGKQSIWIPASGLILRGAAAAYSVVVIGDFPNGVISFDPTTFEDACFDVKMPKSWDAGTFTFRAVWSHAATTVNFGVTWQLSGVPLSDTDLLTTVITDAVQVSDTGGTTNALYTTAESGALTLATPARAAEDVIKFRFARFPSDGGDTMAIDARLHGIMLFYTTSANNDA